MSKGKRRRRHAKPLQQTQSPACSSSPSSPVKEKVRRRDEQHKVNKRHKDKTRLPSSSQVFKKHGLNSESPQAGSSDPPVTGHERTSSGSFYSSQVKAQEGETSRKRSLSSLQRAPPRKVEIVYESDFEFEYKDETQAKVQLQALLALRSPPSSPQRGVSLKKTTPVSDCEYENQTREVSSLSDEDSEPRRRRDQTSPSRSPSSSLQMVVSPQSPTPVSYHRSGNETNEVSWSDEDSERERGREPVSPSRSIPSSRQKAINLTNATPIPSHVPRHTPRGALLSSSLSESQSVFTSESEGESALPSPASPALPERVVGHNTTSVSRPDYGQQSRESSTSDTDDESETASEAEPSSEPGLSFSSPSPWELSRMTTLKRNRSNAHHPSHRKDALPEVESEPMLPSERAWSILPSLDRLANSEPMMQNFRSEHRRKACEKKRRSFPTSSRLNSEIGLETPSKSVAETEWQPAESGTESRYPSPSQTTITPASSPPVPPAASRVRYRVLHPSPPPQRWLPRLERPEQELSLIPPLRYRSDIKPPKVPLMIDGKRFPRVFAEIPPGGHENIEFIFPDNPDDDPDFYDPDSDDPDSELPEAKRRRVELSANSPHPEEQAQREGSPSEAQEASNPQQPSVPESEPEQFLDLESSLDLATWSNPEPLPNLERPSDPEPVPGLEIPSDPERISDPETESPNAPIRNELPIWQIRQLNKKIDKAVEMDKEQNPQHWGGSWMKEYERGRQIKEQIEAAYEQEMVRKKEDMERDKQKRHERNKRLKERREKAKKAMEERKVREDREAQKRMQEEQKRQQKVSQVKEELERRRARARAEKEAEEEPKDVVSILREILDEEKRTTGPQTRSEFRGNQSIERREALQIAMDSVRLLARKKEKENERERGERGEF
ncbi:unnamed protein product [Penicillium viridicatum]